MLRILAKMKSIKIEVSLDDIFALFLDGTTNFIPFCNCTIITKFRKDGNEGEGGGERVLIN